MGETIRLQVTFIHSDGSFLQKKIYELHKLIEKVQHGEARTHVSNSS